MQVTGGGLHLHQSVTGVPRPGCLWPSSCLRCKSSRQMKQSRELPWKVMSLSCLVAGEGCLDRGPDVDTAIMMSTSFSLFCFCFIKASCSRTWSSREQNWNAYAFILTQKAGGIVQWQSACLEHMLASIPSTTKEKKKNQNKQEPPTKLAGAT